MRLPRINTELNRQWKPVYDTSYDIVDGVLPFLASVTIYAVVIALSSHFCDNLRHSPIVHIVGYPVGFLAVFAGWIIGSLTIGLVGGNFSFANSLFPILKDSIFIYTSALLFFSFFVARPVAGILRRIAVPHKTRKRIFFSLLFVSIFAGYKAVEFIGKSHVPEDYQKYQFMYALLIIPYILRAIGKRDRLKDMDTSDFGSERVDERELRDFFENLNSQG